MVQSTLFPENKNPVKVNLDDAIARAKTRRKQREVIARRDKGMARASGHAESVNSNWNNEADAELRLFIETSTEFLAEDFVRWTLNRAIAQPPDKRAWGAVIHRAAMSGIISRVGYKIDQYASPKAVWRRSDSDSITP